MDLATLFKERTDFTLSAIQYLSTSRSRDTAVETFLAATFPNPFQGLLPGSTLNGATFTRANLLRPYPHFGSTFAVERYAGSRC